MNLKVGDFLMNTVNHSGYFDANLNEIDPEISAALKTEFERQCDGIELIASENIVSRASLEALGAIIVNKTVEGYPGKRYYGGAGPADIVEQFAIERAKTLFQCSYANVQPHSGSQANLAVVLAFLKPGDTILSMSLSDGGHLSHGASSHLTGKWFKIVEYGVCETDGLIDYNKVQELAEAHNPQLIICGGSAYPRAIDFIQFRAIADSVGALLLADMAHFAGLVAAGVHMSPLPHAHVSTATTYKNLRGARGGLILSENPEYSSKLNSSVFPGVQGSVMMNAIAAKAVCLKEALRPEFKNYAHAVLENARGLAATLIDRGVEVVTGGTDTPLLLIDLRPKGLSGAEASESLERAGLTCNKNSVPGDTQPPTVTSGLRFGVSAGTTHGFGKEEFAMIGNWIADVLAGLERKNSKQGEIESDIAKEIKVLTGRFPIYSSSKGI